AIQGLGEIAHSRNGGPRVGDLPRSLAEAGVLSVAALVGAPEESVSHTGEIQCILRGRGAERTPPQTISAGSDDLYGQILGLVLAVDARHEVDGRIQVA